MSKKKDKKLQIITFFEKKREKVWLVTKKALPLHPQSREMHLPKRFLCGNSSVGRAQPCQGWGRGSESRFPLNMLNKKEH